MISLTRTSYLAIAPFCDLCIFFGASCTHAMLTSKGLMCTCWSSLIHPHIGIYTIGKDERDGCTMNRCSIGYWRKTSSRRRPRLPPPRCGRWQASSRTAWNSFLSGAFHVVGRKLKPPWDQLSTNSSSSQALEWAGNWADGCWLAQRGTAQQWPDLVLLRGRLGWKNRSHRWSSFPTAIIGQPMSSSHPPARSPAPERE
jgi:hypothetical protein